MNETARLIQPGFSVADAEYPSFSLREGRLLLEFVDWQEQQVRVSFSGVAGVKWHELSSPGPEDRDDAVFEIEESSWLEAYLQEGSRATNESLRHFRLCFNAIGLLDVLASTMCVEGIVHGNAG
jgi:hypothetical protein